MQLNIKLSPGAIMPTQTTSGAACFDLTAKEIRDAGDYIEYNTGISIELPKNYVGLLFPRSSVSGKAMSLANSVGVVDSDYRGEIKARFYYKDKHHLYEIGDRVAQLMIIPIPEVTLNVVDELASTQRGDGGFGSTGK